MLPSTPDLLSVLPDVLDRSISLRMQITFQKIALRLMQGLNRAGMKFLKPDRLVDGIQPWAHIQCISRSLTQDQTQFLVERCRIEKTSVHGAIGAAWLFARTQGMHPAERKDRIVSNPVNVRHLLNIGDAFGMYMSNAVITVPADLLSSFWNTARGIRNRLADAIQTGQVYHWAYTMLKMMHSSPDAMRFAVPAFAAMPLKYTFSISNLGVLPLHEVAMKTSLECVYGPIVNTSEQELTVGACTANGRLTMVLTCRDFNMSMQQAEDLADKAMALLGREVGWLPESQEKNFDQ